MNAIVIPETELQAKDLDKDDILFYSLQEVTLVGDPSPCTNSDPSFWVSPPPCILPGSQAESPPP